MEAQEICANLAAEAGTTYSPEEEQDLCSCSQYSTWQHWAQFKQRLEADDLEATIEARSLFGLPPLS